MYFKRLEIHGFKSFADPVVIDFHEGITCIVGPNGSGKSNISDAIRWVLGEQSPKALRGGKMEEVIFAGTANRKSRGMAEVTLVIDNSAGILNIDYNEVAITRRMFRSGESEYLINNNQCRLRDIRELIMDTGIGVDGYSIIGQGKIADIVSNKPESRREIFEEAAGVVMYKSRKAEAEHKLESVSANLERAQDIISEIESRIGALEEDSKKAEEYIDLRDQLRELDINIILKSIDNINKNGDTFTNDIAKLKEEIEEKTSDRNNAAREDDNLNVRRDELERTASDTNGEILRLVEEINAITGKAQLEKERLNSIEKEQQHLRTDIDQLKRRSDEEEVQIQEHDQRSRDLAGKIAEGERILQEQKQQLDRATEERDRLEDTVENGKQRLFELHSKHTTSISESSSMENIQETLRKRKAELTSLASSSVQSVSDYDRELEGAKKQLEIEKVNLEKIDDQINQYKWKIEELQEQINANSKASSEKSLELSRLTTRRKTLEELEGNYEGYNAGVKALMRANLPGMIGVTADLITVPRGYEQAIETAMGPAMQNIVCGNDRDAQVGVRYLKNNQAGRLTFLPVGSIKGYIADGYDRIKGESGFLGMASDLITFEEEYRGVFEYLLGRTAIVEDMPGAVRLSKMKTGLRLVTLDGEVVSPAGAITGGAYKNKSANILERKSEIKELTEKAADLEREIGKLLQASNATVESMDRHEDLLDGAEENRQAIKLAIVTATSNIETITGRLEEERMSGGRYTNELNHVEEELARAAENINALRMESATAKEEIDQLNKDLTAAGDNLERAKKEVESLTASMTRAQMDVNDYTTHKNSVETLLNRERSAFEDYRRQMDDKTIAISTLEDEKNDILRGSGYESDNVDSMRAKKQELEKVLESVSREKEVIAQKRKVIDDEQRRRDIDLQALTDQKSQLEIKVAKNETQLETFKERLWDEFEVSFAQALDMKQENFALTPAIRESRQIKSRIKDLGDVNVGAIQEFKDVSQRHQFLLDQRGDILKAREELESIIRDMDMTIRTRFKENFDKIVAQFEEIFQELFGGGHAELRLDNENDPLSAGIDIIAQPPGKKLQNINLMSGGEKTMTAIALMFAVLKTKPTPFCILDEVEAALDDANIDRFAGYLRHFREIQFALVTHQKATMEHADVLYGITMAEHGISKVLSLKLGDDFDLGEDK